MVILDGPDGAGKPTLGRQLEAEGYTYLPSPRIAAKGNVDRMKYETDRYLRLYGKSPAHVVDRMLFSEQCYGPVLRGKSAFSRIEYLGYLFKVMQCGIHIVFCLPENHFYKINESPLLIAQMPKIKAKYEEIYDLVFHSYPRTFKYDWQKPGAYERLKSFIRET